MEKGERNYWNLQGVCAQTLEYTHGIVGLTPY